MLNIDRVVELGIEHLDIIFEDVWLLLQDEIDVAESHILKLWLARHEADQRSSQLLDVNAAVFGRGDVVNALENDFDCREHHSRVAVRQARADALTDQLGLFRVLRVVRRNRLENEDLAPLIRLVDGRENFVQILALIELEVVLTALVRNLKERSTGVCYDDRIAVLEQALQQLDQVLLDNDTWRYSIQLCNGKSGRFFDVRVEVV